MKALSSALIVVLLLVLVSCSSDRDKANELVVEATKLYKQAEKEPDAQKKFELIDRALSDLKKIVKDYPNTDIATKLSTGQSIGFLSLKKLKQFRTQAACGVCFAHPRQACLLNTARTIVTGLSGLFKSDWYPKSLVRIASAQAESGFIDDARKTAESIKDPFHQSQALAFVAMATKDRALFDQALATANKSATQKKRDQALHGIAILMQRAGFFNDSQKVVHAITNEYDRLLALAAILVNKKDPAFSQKVSNLVSKSTLPANKLDSVLSQLSIAQSFAGLYADAKKNAEKIQIPEERTKAFLYLALETKDAALFKEAINSAKGIKNASSAIKLLRTIVLAQAKVGFTEDALKFLKKMQKAINNNAAFRSHKCEVIGDEAIIYAYAGSKDKALSIIEKMNGCNAEDRMRVFSFVAQKLNEPSLYARAMSARTDIKSIRDLVDTIIKTYRYFPK